MSFPNSSSAGLDGILPQILKDLTAKSNGQTGLIFLRALTNLVNVILEGKVPFELRPYFFGAELIELKKSRWRTSSYRCRQYIPPIVRKMCRILCLRITSSKIWKSTSRCILHTLSSYLDVELCSILNSTQYTNFSSLFRCFSFAPLKQQNST